MAEQNITCPNCGTEIPLTETLSRQAREGIRREFEAEAKEREAKFKAREAELAAERTRAEAELKRRFEAERRKLADEAAKKARETVDVELKDLREAAAERERELADARAKELELRKRARALDEEKKNLELTVERKLDAERESIRRNAVEAFTEEHRLKDLEKDKQMNDLRRSIEEWKRKAEQGSMQTQGEVLEEDLEGLLKNRFPMDIIEPVPKGVRGVDIVQRVRTTGGRDCGAIAWELKRTKAWSDEWLVKLRDDQRELKAEIGVIVSETLPKGHNGMFSLVDGVWVASLAHVVPLTEALRMGLEQVAMTRASAEGRGEKMEAIYGYLAGAEFRHKIEGIVEAFSTMRGDLDRERSAMMRIWAKREKQIERVVDNTLKLYGDMQGIMGASLPEIKALELEGGDDMPEA